MKSMGRRRMKTAQPPCHRRVSQPPTGAACISGMIGGRDKGRWRLYS